MAVVLLFPHTEDTVVRQYFVGYTSAKVFAIVQRSTFTVRPYLRNDIKHITKSWNRKEKYISTTTWNYIGGSRSLPKSVNLL
jgi:hypothetical protein